MVFFTQGQRCHLSTCVRRSGTLGSSRLRLLNLTPVVDLRNIDVNRCKTGQNLFDHSDNWDHERYSPEIAAWLARAALQR